MALDPATRSAQARFRSGLLAWLRLPGDAAGLREMIAVLRDLPAAGAPGDGLVWRSAAAFLASLLDGSRPADDETRRMCARIERHLSAHLRGQPLSDAALCEALFAFLSGRGAGPAAPAAVPPATTIQRAMGDSLARTAEILPLFIASRVPRHDPAAVANWLDAVAALDAAWQEFAHGRAADCRAQTTRLVAAALVVNAPSGLQLAEALATACAGAEDPGRREQPALRAAIAAALEIAGDGGPNHPYFDERVAHAARRLRGIERETRPAGGAGAKPAAAEPSHECPPAITVTTPPVEKGGQGRD